MSRGPLLRLARLLFPWDRFREALGILPDQGEVPEEVAGLLEAHAERFLRGGGTVSLREWARMTTAERAALTVAGSRLRAEIASATGFASSAPAAALAVHGVIDGGRLASEIANHVAIDDAARKIAAERERRPPR